MTTDIARLATVELLGGRRFWVVRSTDLPDDGFQELFDALAAQSDPEEAGTLGVCVLVPPSDAGRRPEAEWPDPRTIYAGRLDDGTQVRVAYFEGAIVRPRVMPAQTIERWMTDEGPAIVEFREQDAVSAQDVVDLWLREGALPEDEARRRVAEVDLVAVEDDGTVVGVSTSYLQHSARLDLPMHFVRSFVAASERRKATAGRLTIRIREWLEARHVGGRDTRGSGMVFEIENEGVKMALPEAYYLGSDVTFVGVNERGDDFRVRYFPGARVPW